MKYIKGNVRQIIYSSSSGYKVGLFKVKETDDEELNMFLNKTITFTGFFNDLNTEVKYKLFGELIEHPKYGYQYVVKKYEKEEIKGTDAIFEFLSSSLINGCGEKTAQKIIEVFGDETISKIKERYENLLLVTGMSKKRAEKIYNSVIKYDEKDELLLFLQEYGFSIKEATTLIAKYDLNIKDIVISNIYLLNEIISFRKLDQIFLLHNDPNDLIRIKACLVETMKSLAFQNGDTYYYLFEIVEGLYTIFNLRMEEEIFNNILNELIDDNIIVKENDTFQLKIYQDMEKSIVDSLYKISLYQSETYDISKAIKAIEKNVNLKFDNNQITAISESLNNNIMIITGGPGTGKTTIVDAIVKSFISLNNYNNIDIMRNIALLAPTGRASRKLSEVTGLPAKTIHRFLKWNKEKNEFGVNKDNKSGEKLIIIDEISMVDTYVFASLLEGLTSNIKLILIGDANQLPSVGGGLILNDLISSGLVKHILLDKIYRQSDISFIPYLARDIKNKHLSENFDEQRNDFNFISVANGQIKNMIEQICLKYIEKGINEKNMIVLIPMYKGENGIDNINILLQRIFNPLNKQREYKFGDVIFRENDKVIQLVNDPDNNVFNGDIGYISSINKNSKNLLEVDFDGNIITYKRDDLLNIKHAYAISIHKSQGSEFDHVIVPVTTSYNKMLYNKLIYTGISRAKKSLIVIGSKEAFINAVNNDYSEKRKTKLSVKLVNKFMNN